MLPRFLWEIQSVFYVLSYGMNQYRNKSKSIHAENAALTKLKNRTSKKKKKVNILVIKTSKTGILGNSKPCYYCMLDLKNYSPIKGYKINNVYYSDTNGEIIKKKLSHMFSEGNYHFSSYYKNIQKNKLGFEF